MLISIIIPFHSLNKQLEECLKSIKDNSSKISIELILVSDGVKGDPSFFNQFHFPSVNIIELSENRGPAFARNAGAKHASGKVLFFLDSDVTINSNTVNKVLDHFGRPDCEVALIGSYNDKPADSSTVSRFRNLLHHYTHQTANEQLTTFWGACGAIKKESFKRVGGFNENFKKPSIEDIELGYRLIDQGFRIRIDKSLQVKHLKRWTLLNMIRTDICYRARPWSLLLLKNRRVKENNLNLRRSEKIAAVSAAVTIVALCLGIIFPSFFLIALVGSGLVTILKWNVYTFFSKHFSFMEMPFILVLHWVYLISALIGFILGVFEFIFDNRKPDAGIN